PCLALKIIRHRVFTFSAPPLFLHMKPLPHEAMAMRGVVTQVAVATAVACLATFTVAAAQQTQAALKKPTMIPAQGLGPALQQLARDRDVQLVYRSELVGSRQTNGAMGELTFEEALRRLLEGTGLTFQYLEDKAITIVPLA